MDNVLIGIKPIQPNVAAQLIITAGGALRSIDLAPEMPLSITPDAASRYCTGWYDIAAHTPHLCPNASTVDEKYTSCYTCRQKTDFNPAFYNASSISDKQNAYNKTPHFVYIAYFGGKLAKAGIAATSRGTLRLYEQEALLYSILQEFPDAYTARAEEVRLIRSGFKETVSKKQKQALLQAPETRDTLTENFTEILHGHGIDTCSVESNLEIFFYDIPPNEPIVPLQKERPISGKIRGIVGGYLVLENNERLYGLWLSSLLGYPITISDTITSIKAEPLQVSLF